MSESLIDRINNMLLSDPYAEEQAREHVARMARLKAAAAYDMELDCAEDESPQLFSSGEVGNQK